MISGRGLLPSLLRIGVLLAVAYAVVVILVAVFQRSLIYLPQKLSAEELGRLAAANGLQLWTNQAGVPIGWKRPSPRQPSTNAVLIFHGNAGTAAGRAYLATPLQEAMPFDVFLVEYPGYADRPGRPSQESILAAATDAVDALTRYSHLYAVGESLGSASACYIAGRFPNRVAGVQLLVPFDRLVNVAAAHYPWLPVRALLRDSYPSAEWIQSYTGPLGVLLAGSDRIVPTRLGRALYDGYSGPKKVWEIPGADHEDVLNQSPEWWSEVGELWGVRR